MIALIPSFMRCGRVRALEYAERIADRVLISTQTADDYEAYRAEYGGMTMRDYLRYTWNHPNRGQAPYTYFEGVMKPVGVDGNGDVIYTYDQERTFVEGGDGW